MLEKKRTNIQLQVDTEIWNQFAGLAKFLRKDRNELLNEAMADRIKKEREKK